MHRSVRLFSPILVCALLFSLALTLVAVHSLQAQPNTAPMNTARMNAVAVQPASAPLAQATPSDDAGQEYIVQSGDSLYQISGRFYANPNAYPRIVDATNAKAAVDARFTPIADARTIQSGQRLWIPDRADLPIVTSERGAVPTSEPIAEPNEVVATPEAIEESEVAENETTENETTENETTENETTENGVAFVAPLDGATVAPTFVVTMSATGLTVEAAGDINPNAGHFHILVDTAFVPAGDVILFDEQHIHFGKGQITTTLDLEPGEHVLRLQFANGAHIALDGDEYRDTITVTVGAGDVATSMMEGPGVYFVDPLDGATVPPTFTVAMAANELTVEPAGDINPNAGHFHILVDTDFTPAGDVIISDEQHLHFGKAQITTTLNLEPGEHVLRLQFANGAHIALDGDEYRDTITVTVDADAIVMPMFDGPGVLFVDPLDGATVPPTFTVTMAANELTVEPAGDINPNAGHFHILVDTDFVPAGDTIIFDEQHIHFGKGQVTTTLNLEPGEHVLRLQFANGAHIALDGDEYRDTITVTVDADAIVMPMMDGPGVYFVDPLDGATVPSTFTVAMAANELTVEPAGTISPNAGHFHILVDADFTPAGDVIISDEQHLHFGKGQLTTTLNLEPGEHVLRLQFANGAHIALDGDEYRDTITVTVDADNAAMGDNNSSEAIHVHFVTPKDGDTVDASVDVVMAADGLIVEPAGTISASAGHFHILIDTDFVAAGDVIITDDQHLHYGKGQAVTTLELTPGEHVLRLQFANGAHIALDGDEYQDEITVTVQE